MTLFPQMVCCKPMRQVAGLACEPGWMVCCLAEQCAKFPTLQARREFATQVARVQCVSSPELQEIFRAQVHRLYEARKRAGK